MGNTLVGNAPVTSFAVGSECFSGSCPPERDSIPPPSLRDGWIGEAKLVLTKRLVRRACASVKECLMSDTEMTLSRDNEDNGVQTMLSRLYG